MKLIAICLFIFLSYQVTAKEDLDIPKSISHYKTHNNHLRGEFIRILNIFKLQKEINIRAVQVNQMMW